MRTVAFLCFNHQGKGEPFIRALQKKYRYLPGTLYHKDLGFVLTDNDVLNRRVKLENLRRAGIKKFFVYPHAARPSLVSAFYETWPHTTVQFVVNGHHAEVMRRLGHVGKLESVGWSLCPIVEFKPRSIVKNVLFAPIHPRNSAIDKKLNQAVLDKLYPLARAGAIRLTVRYLEPFEGNGIIRYENHVDYRPGTVAPSYTMIDESDVVIAHQTYAYIAVARGVPTLMMGEDFPPHIEYRDGKRLEARGWQDYKDLIIYPLDILNEDDTLSMMAKAAASDQAIKTWRDRMIGDQFDDNKFITILDKYL